MRLGVSLLMDISSFKQRAYPYRFVMNQKEDDLSWLLYSFKSSFTNQVYLVRVERLLIIKRVPISLSIGIN